MSHELRMAAAAAALLLMACGKDNEVEESAGALVDSPAVTAKIIPPEGPPIVISVSEKDGSMVLTDGAGRTLYVADNSPSPTAAARAGFTPVTGKATPGNAAVKAELVGITTLPDGSVQVTYAEQPLYIFAGDSTAGDTKGRGKTANGTTFTTVDPSGKKSTKSTKR